MRKIVYILIFISSFASAQTKYQKDFAFYWNTVKENLAYFDTQKTDWEKVKKIYQPAIDTVTNRDAFIQLLELMNNEFYNGHISLNTNLASSNRLIPTGADLWVKYENGQYIISAIRENYNADRCGLKTGMRIIRYNGEPVDSALRTFLPVSFSIYNKAMYEYAANMLLAGRHNVKREITTTWKGKERSYFPDTVIFSSDTLVVEYKKLSSGIGYIRINNSLGNDALIKSFDAALDSLWNTNGLIIDLRETPSGGNTTNARAIMSRFIDKEMPYQKHSIPAEEMQYGVKRSWIELVSPRSTIYTKPMVILVNQWTGSMGEGIAIGFDGMKRAKIVGDKMAGLLGAIYSFTMPETNIGFSIPAEKVFHVNGTPREEFMPGVIVTDNKEYIPTAVQLLAPTEKK
jgi:C-terminal processing protease CtpA/Prc